MSHTFAQWRTKKNLGMVEEEVYSKIPKILKKTESGFQLSLQMSEELKLNKFKVQLRLFEMGNIKINKNLNIQLIFWMSNISAAFTALFGWYCNTTKKDIKNCLKNLEDSVVFRLKVVLKRSSKEKPKF